MAEMGFTPQRGDSQGRGAGRGGRGALCPLLGTVLRAPTRGRGVGTEAVRPHAAVPGSSMGGAGHSPMRFPCAPPPNTESGRKRVLPSLGAGGAPGRGPSQRCHPLPRPQSPRGLARRARKTDLFNKAGKSRPRKEAPRSAQRQPGRRRNSVERIPRGMDSFCDSKRDMADLLPLPRAPFSEHERLLQALVPRRPCPRRHRGVPSSR